VRWGLGMRWEQVRWGRMRGRRRAAASADAEGDPFAVLGLPARPDLTDDDVRVAWRRIAARNHPDRDDGGDPLRFAVAAAAYATLRTSDGRGEALADRGGPGSRGLGSGGLGSGGPRRVVPGQALWTLMLRLFVAAAVCAGSFLAAGWSPGTVGVFAGALTWLAVSFPRRMRALRA
jgi:hypothetical protein